LTFCQECDKKEKRGRRMQSAAYDRAYKKAKEFGSFYTEKLEQGKRYADDKGLVICYWNSDRDDCCTMGAVFMALGIFPVVEEGEDCGFEQRWPSQETVYRYLGGSARSWNSIIDANEDLELDNALE